MKYRIGKQIKWHMAHRILNHKSKCRSNHGHTYLLSVYILGSVIEQQGISDEGMIMDFGDVKEILTRKIYDVLDHGSMFWEHDPLVPALEADIETKLVKVPFVPTAENIAKWCFEQVYDEILIEGQRQLESVRLYETPNSWADYSPPHLGVPR